MPEMVAMSYPAQGALVKIVVLEEESFEVGTKEIKMKKTMWLLIILK